MDIELLALLVTGVMAYLAIFVQTNHGSIAYGMAHSLSNRATSVEETALGGRLSRAVNNSIEAVAYFTPLVLVAQFSDTSNTWTQYAAIVFMASRILYLPAYAFGLVPVRSIVWMTGFFSIPFFIYGLLA